MFSTQLHTTRPQRFESSTVQNYQPDRSVDFQSKYRKALKQISGIIKANKQLKQQLDKLKSIRGQQMECFSKIQKDQFERAYEKVLKEKNQIAILNQNLQFQNQKLKYSSQSLEEYVAQLKNQQMNLIRQKQALERTKYKKSNIIIQQQSQSSKQERLSTSKEYIEVFKQKEVEYHRTIENYQEHHANLNRINRRLEETISELRDKLQKNDNVWKSAIQNKQNQLLELKSQIRKDYQTQMNNLKRQNSDLRNKMIELQIKNQNYQLNSQHYNKQQLTKYDLQLFESLKSLRDQMHPIKTQLVELQSNNDYEKQQCIRQLSQLKLKVMEMQNQLTNSTELNKSLEKNLIEMSESQRKYKQQQKFMHRLEEENKILGGRILVLESKDIALRNRNGQQLQQRVLQFQTRVQILLSSKQNFANIKNVSIHQLIALKAYVMQLDSKLKSLINENEYSNKKYKQYKQRYVEISRQSKKHEIILNSYKSKIIGYDKLVLKLQKQLQKSLKLYDFQMKIPSPQNQQNNVNIEAFKKKAEMMSEKLQLQNRYAKQQLQTMKLNYQTQIMQLQIQIEDINNIKSTLQLYKNKNAEYARTINQRENQIIQLKIQLSNQSTGLNNSDFNTKELLQPLKKRIQQKNQQLNQMQIEIQTIEDRWQQKYITIQKQKSKVQSNSRQLQQTIENLQNNIKTYRQHMAGLQNQLTLTMKKSWMNDDNKLRQYMQKNTQLEFALEQIQNKYNLVQVQKNKSQQRNKELKEQIEMLENQLNRKKLENKKQNQQLSKVIQEKDENLRNQQHHLISNTQELEFKLIQSENQNKHLLQKVQNLKEQIAQLSTHENDENLKKSQVNNLYIALKQKYQQQQQQKYQIETNIRKLESNLTHLKTQLKQKQQSYLSLRNNFNESISSEKKIVQSQLQTKDILISHLNQQINSLKVELQSLYTKDDEIMEMKNQIHRLKLNPKIDEFYIQIQQLNSQNINLNIQLKNVINQLKFKSEEIDSLSQNISRGHEEFLEIKTKNYRFETENFQLANKVQRITAQNNFYKEQISEHTAKIQRLQKQIDGYINELRTLRPLKLERQELVRQIQQKQQIIRKLTSQIRMIHCQMQIDNVQEKQNSIHKLKSQLHDINIQIINQKRQFEDKINEKQQKLEKYKRELASERENSSNQANKIGQLENYLYKVRQEFSLLENQLKIIQEIVNEKQKKIADLSFQLNKGHDTINELNRKSENMQHNLTNTQRQLNDLKRLSNDITNTASQKQQIINRYNYELNYQKETTTSLQIELGHKQQVIQRQIKQLHLMKDQLKQTQQIVYSKEVIVSNLTFSFNQMRTKYQFLQQDYNLKEKQRLELLHKYQNLKVEFNSYEDELNAKNKNIGKLRSEINTLKEDIIIVTQQLGEKNGQITRLNKQLFKNNDLENNEIQSQKLNFLYKQISSLSYKIQILEQQLKEKDQNIEAERRANKMLRSQSEQIGNTSEYSNLSKQNIDLKEKIEKLMQTIKIERQKYKNSQSRDIENMTEYSHLQKQNLDLKEKIENLIQTIKVQRQAYKISQNKKIENRSEYQNLQKQNTELKENIQNLMQTIKIKQNIIAQMLEHAKKRNQSNQINKNFEADRQRLEADIQMLTSSLRKMQQRQRKFYNQLQQGNTTQSRKSEQIKKSFLLYQKQIDRLHEIIDSLQNQISLLRLKLTTMINQQDRVEENLVTMVLTFTEVDALRNRIIEKENQINQVRKSLIGVAKLSQSHVASHYFGRFQQQKQYLNSLFPSHIFDDQFKNKQKKVNEVVRQKHLRTHYFQQVLHDENKLERSKSFVGPQQKERKRQQYRPINFGYQLGKNQPSETNKNRTIASIHQRSNSTNLSQFAYFPSHAPMMQSQMIPIHQIQAIKNISPDVHLSRNTVATQGRQIIRHNMNI